MWRCLCSANRDFSKKPLGVVARDTSTLKFGDTLSLIEKERDARTYAPFNGAVSSLERLRGRP